MGAILALLTGFLTFAVGSAFPGSVFKTTSSVQKAFYGRCYSIEPKEKLTLKREDFDIVHADNPTSPMCYDGAKSKELTQNGLIDTYTRVRKNVHVVQAKIEEGSKSNGGCDYTNDLRLVAQNGNNMIYWEDQNYNGGDLRDFVAVLQGRGGVNQGSIMYLGSAPQEEEDYIFDFYAKDSILNNLPDFITHCRDSGGLVPVVEGESGILPPQLVPMKDIDTSLYKKNYEAIFLSANISFPPYKNYLIKIDKQDLPAEALEKGQIGIYTTPQVNNSRHAYDVFYHLSSFYLRDRNDQTSYVYGSNTDGPPQTVDNNPSLQLGRLWFRVVDSWTAFTPNCKPAIYLYPDKPTDMNVKVNLLGKLTKTDPQYDFVQGWNVKAFPDGTIKQITDNRQQITNSYQYLFYEAELEKGYKPKEGWVIERSNIKYQISNIMKTLGLNEKETDDFLAYWLPKLVSKPYYFAGLVPVEEIDKQEVLTINPSPSNIIRVRIIFEGLDYPISVTSPKLLDIKREGFTAVDWGGTLVGQSCEGKKIQ